MSAGEQAIFGAIMLLFADNSAQRGERYGLFVLLGVVNAGAAIIRMQAQ